MAMACSTTGSSWRRHGRVGEAGLYCRSHWEGSPGGQPGPAVALPLARGPSANTQPPAGTSSISCTPAVTVPSAGSGSGTRFNTGGIDRTVDVGSRPDGELGDGRPEAGGDGGDAVGVGAGRGPFRPS